MLVLRRVLSMGLLCGGLVGQVATYRNGELMSEDKYTPTTEEVRARYAADEFGYSAAPDDPCPEFDRWLAERDLAAFNDGFAQGAEMGM
jgi:hypothetical protein